MAPESKVIVTFVKSYNPTAFTDARSWGLEKEIRLGPIHTLKQGSGT